MSPGSCAKSLAVITMLVCFLGGCSLTPQPSLEVLHRSTVMVEHAGGHGTGSIIAPDLVLTADHVITEEPVAIRFFEGEVHHGEVRWRNPDLDLALLRVDVPRGYPITGWNCGMLEEGEHLVLIGHPTHSRWVAIGGHLPTVDPLEGPLVALGFPIGLGTSGGPVFDEDGRIVGVALAILAERSSETANFGDFKDTGIGLMLPASQFCTDVGLIPVGPT